jgi:ribonuclease BN (tRNA processing enzyme)
MKLTFIGCGSAFTTPEYYQSNMMITSSTGKNMLIDCGTDIRFSLSECNIRFRTHPGEEIDAVYISHLHSDHVAGMEWFAFDTYFDPNPQRPKLFMEEELMHELWTNSLKAGLGCIEGKRMHLTDYFECHPVENGQNFYWENICFTMIRMPHIITGYKNLYSYALLMKEVDKNGPLVFLSTDTQFQPDIIKKVAKSATIIFHDCETSPYHSLVHAHYDDLSLLAPEIKRKMWLYHYQPKPEQDPKKDGFLGFVTKGQQFDFPSERD